MSRKNIFQLIKEHYAIENEIYKIHRLFYGECYFCDSKRYYTLPELIDEYLLVEWGHRGTCLNVEELITRSNADITLHKQIAENTIINFLEVVENFINLYHTNKEKLRLIFEIECISYFDEVFCQLITTLERYMGLTKRIYRDKVVLYLKNAPLEKVLNSIEDEDVQWELIRYEREKMTLSEKRKTLAYLATNLYIESDKTEKDSLIKELTGKATNILNNLHIRHNNNTGKWEKVSFKFVSNEDAIMLCDMLFNEMLTIILLRDHKKYESTYADFCQKQKQMDKATHKKA